LPAELPAVALRCRSQLHLDLPDWDYPEFRQAHLGDYLGMTAEFMEEFKDQLA
jgi:predicted ATP-dependent Lon-type protease